MSEIKTKRIKNAFTYFSKQCVKKAPVFVPLWGIGAGLAIACLMFGAIWGNQISTKAEAEAINNPKILGDFIDLRGSLPEAPSAPKLSIGINDSSITSQSYLVADSVTGKVLAQKNSGSQQYVASLTKLLTALVSYEQVDINAWATITPADTLDVNPSLHIRTGDAVKLLDLFNAMLIGSNNDAALALANHTADISGQNFIELMNKKTLDLGMVQSHFSNPMGFDSPQNYSTAEDLLKLVMATQKYAAFTQLGKKTSYSFESAQRNFYETQATDKLVGKHEEIEAVKTGFTQGAGQAMITKITKNSHSFIIIVLDSKNREGDTLELEKQILETAIWE